MSDNKALYIERLLNEIKSLHENVLEVNNSGNLPFSFFKESFNKTREITDLLHKLEFMQIDDLKSQMERLVLVLTEKKKKEEEAAEEEQQREYQLSQDKNQVLTKDSEHVVYQTKDQEEDIEPKEVFVPEQHSGNKYAEGITLPEYRNPYNSADNQHKKQGAHIIEENHFNKLADSENKANKTIVESKNSARSLNDIIKTPTAVVDLKRGISLNDRFFFQRELFGNDRHRMNSTIEKLNDLESYEEVEKYIRENVSMDLENPIVIDFLSIIRKEFK